MKWKKCYLRYFKLDLYFRYKAFRDPEGEYTMFFWHLLAVRLAFVIIFEVRNMFINNNNNKTRKISKINLSHKRKQMMRHVFFSCDFITEQPKKNKKKINKINSSPNYFKTTTSKWWDMYSVVFQSQSRT